MTNLKMKFMQNRLGC